MSWQTRSHALLENIRRQPSLGIAVLLIVFSMWAFAELTSGVLDGEVKTIDVRVLSALRSEADPQVPVGPEWLRGSMRDVTALGSTTVLALTVAGAALLLWLSGARHTAVFLLVASGAGLLISHEVKWYFGRPRPDVVPHLTAVQTPSFPSTHAMMSAVVYLTIALLLAAVVGTFRLKVFFLASACGLVGLIGFSRVYLGVHYPTDVAAGWMIGLAWALTCWLVAKALQSRGAVGRSLGAPE